LVVARASIDLVITPLAKDTDDVVFRTAKNHVTPIKRNDGIIAWAGVDPKL
jgi:hypothetical protein